MKKSKKEDREKLTEQEELDLLDLELENQVEVVDDKYSIFNYLKKTPSITIAIISGIIAICSVIFDYISELSIDITLNHWQIDRSMVEFDNSFIIKNIVTVCIVLLLNLLAVIFIYYTFFTYQSSKSFYLQEKKNNDKFREEINVILGSTDDEKRIDIAKELMESTYQDDNFIDKLQKYDLKTFYISLMLSFILSAFAIFMSFYVDRSIFKITEEFYFVPILMTIYYFLGWILSIVSFKSSKKTRKNKNVEEFSKKEIRTFFSNRTILMSLIMCAFLIIGMFVSQISITIEQIDKQKSYKTMSINNQEYAVVFSDKNNLFLEEIVYNKDNAVIYTSKQLIIPKTNANLVLKNFKKVETFDKQINDKKQTNQKN